MPTIRTRTALAALFALTLALPAAAWPTDDEVRAAQRAVKASAVAKPFLASAYGYALLPTVGRGAFAVGGAYGEGFVFKQGKRTGKTTLAQLSIGLGAGGEAYTEIVFFKDKAAYDRFVAGHLELNARATAAVGSAAAQGELGYSDGVAIVTLSKGGLIADASVGGQRFTFEKL